ncbi:8584_t:CDS:2, partial [Ambispora leptoticha]
NVEIGSLPTEFDSPSKGKRIRTETKSAEEDNLLNMLPISHEIKLNDHFKTLQHWLLILLARGSYDYDIKFWDFAGMDSSLRPFHSLRPCGDHQIHHIEYSLSGDQFLIISGSARLNYMIEMASKCEAFIEEYIKGDPYIRDMRNTSRHVAALTSGGWHPHDKKCFFTASADSTIRLWDVENKRKQKQVIVFKTKERGGRTIVTAVAYSPDAKLIAAAVQDGNLCFWPVNRLYMLVLHT